MSGSIRSERRTIPLSKYNLEISILTALLPNGILLPHALTTITDNQAYLRSVLTRLKHAGLVSDRHRTLKAPKATYTIRYLEIQSAALSWLKEHSDIDWLSYLPDPLPSYTVSSDYSNSKLIRLLNSRTAEIVFSQLNIPTCRDETCHVGEQKWKLKDLIQDCKSQCKNVNEPVADTSITENKGTNMYFHSYSINENFKLSPTEIRQYQFSTHVGILVRRSKSYLVYAATPTGLVIQPRAALRTRTFAGMFLSRNRLTSETSVDAVQDSLIFCRNEKEFKKMFDKSYDAMNKNSTYTLSHLFHSVYAIPVTRDGVYMLDTIFYYQDNAIDLIEAASRAIADKYPCYTLTSAPLFPLKCDSDEVYVGIDMNLTNLQRFISNVMSEYNRSMS